VPAIDRHGWMDRRRGVTQHAGGAENPGQNPKPKIEESQGYGSMEGDHSLGTHGMAACLKAVGDLAQVS
jgi:hypothetical protein